MSSKKESMNDMEDMQAEAAAEAEETQAVKEQDGSDELMVLQEKLAESEAKAAENLDGWQRAQAEFANYKKRQVSQQEVQAAEVRGRVIKHYLEISDDLERALKKRPQDEEGAAWAAGIELIYQKLQGYLQSEGLTRIDPLGETFDPNLHEAVAQEDSAEQESGAVIEVLRPGYMLGERVLRPASVKVAK